MQTNKALTQLNIENLRHPIDFNPQITQIAQIFLHVACPYADRRELFGSGLSGLGYSYE
jgi:hypothetical protein